MVHATNKPFGHPSAEPPELGKAVGFLDQMRLDTLAHLLIGMFPLLRSERTHL
jgi:hypothetical protein